MTKLDFTSDIILEDQRVQLRPLVLTDAEHLLPYSLHEPDLWQYSLVSGAGRENLEKYIQQALDNKVIQDSYPFIVFDKQAQAFAGSTRFYDYSPTHNTVQLGYTWYGKAFHRSGLNRHCKQLMLSYAFDKLQIDRVEFRADNNNTKSIAAMEAIGCTREGVLRSNCSSPTGRRDSIILSILRSEWHDTIKAQLKSKIR